MTTDRKIDPKLRGRDGDRAAIPVWLPYGAVLLLFLSGLGLFVYASAAMDERLPWGTLLMFYAALPCLLAGLAAAALAWKLVRGRGNASLNIITLFFAAFGAATAGMGATLLANDYLGGAAVSVTRHVVESKAKVHITHSRSGLNGCAIMWHVSTREGPLFSVPLKMGELLKPGDTLEVRQREGWFGFAVLESFSSATLTEPAGKFYPRC